jgi:hypothetical protein
MTDAELAVHPLFEKLVPLLAAVPPGAGHVVTIRFRDGQPQHLMPDYALPESPAGALFRLGWPRPVPPAITAVCAQIGAWLPTIGAEHATGDLLVAVDLGAARPYGLRWRGSLAVRPVGR